ncbi:hypothetical protein FKW77_001804 [Venturia effusa]|uniref:Uncharacterized protein n=1 Tax=Venturia effusa TaxID=50376 RepID=A0A517L8N4_9PEZI|nr:hypothetical protein FKW77_001804 [Venturia effusa]
MPAASFLSLPCELRHQILLLTHEYSYFDRDITSMRNWSLPFKTKQRQLSVEWTRILRKISCLLVADVDYTLNKVLEAHRMWKSAYEARKRFINQGVVGEKLTEEASEWYGLPNNLGWRADWRSEQQWRLHLEQLRK